jgi:hypothetical protein
MIGKVARLTKITLMSILLLTGVVIFASCVPTTTPTTTEPERMLPAIAVVPNVITVGKATKVQFAGADFEPGEKVRMGVLFFLGVETTPGLAGLALEVNELGSFLLADDLNPTAGIIPPGAYPVRVYDEEGKVIASTLVIVVEAAE